MNTVLVRLFIPLLPRLCAYVKDSRIKQSDCRHKQTSHSERRRTFRKLNEESASLCIMASWLGDDKRVDAAALTRCNFNASALKAEGFSAAALRFVHFDAYELREASFTALELRVAGYSEIELFRGGYSAKQLFEAGFSHSRLQVAGFEAIEQHEELGLTAAALRSAGYKSSELRKIGFLAIDMKAAGYSAAETLVCCSPPELARAGYSKDQLQPIGAWAHDGTYNSFYSHWSCCQSTDGNSLYCASVGRRI